MTETPIYGAVAAELSFDPHHDLHEYRLEDLLASVPAPERDASA